MNVILCATHRSGSTLLHELLGSTGVIGVPPFREFDNKHPFSEQLIPCANGVASVKVMSADIEIEKILLKEATSMMSSMSSEIEETLLQSKLIWIRRKNKVRQAISWLKALKSNVWNIWKWSTEPTPIVDIDMPEIEEYILKLEYYERLWSDFFHNHDLDPIVVWYEDLVVDTRKVVSGVLKSLGLTPQVWPPQTERVKLSDAHTERVYAAYQKSLKVYNEALRHQS